VKKRFHDAILSIKNPFLFGTLLLTAGGLLTRVLGFFYRIWLAGVIGEVGMGIYQLVFPVFGVAFALCATAIQTSISRFTAEAMSQKNHHRCLLILQTGLACSLLLSLLCGIFIYRKADFLATHILNAPECAHLLPYIAVMLPQGLLIIRLSQLGIGGDTLHQTPAGPPDDHIFKHRHPSFQISLRRL